MTSESNAEPAEAWKMLDQAVVIRAVFVGQSSSCSRRQAVVVGQSSGSRRLAVVGRQSSFGQS